MPKVVIFGLDCAPPRLAFEEWKKKLPNMKRLMDEGFLRQ